MENVMLNGFTELSTSEMDAIDGGFALTATLVTIWGVQITGVMCIKAGAALGLAASAIVALS